MDHHQPRRHTVVHAPETHRPRPKAPTKPVLQTTRATSNTAGVRDNPRAPKCCGCVVAPVERCARLIGHGRAMVPPNAPDHSTGQQHGGRKRRAVPQQPYSFLNEQFRPPAGHKTPYPTAMRSLQSPTRPRMCSSGNPESGAHPFSEHWGSGASTTSRRVSSSAKTQQTARRAGTMRAKTWGAAA